MIIYVLPGYYYWWLNVQCYLVRFTVSEKFTEGHKFISFFLTVTCLPSLNKGITLPYLTLPYTYRKIWLFYVPHPVTFIFKPQSVPNKLLLMNFSRSSVLFNQIHVIIICKHDSPLTWKLKQAKALFWF